MTGTGSYPDGKLVNDEYERTGKITAMIAEHSRDAEFLIIGQWAMDCIYRNHWSAQYAH